ncbi:MAG: SAM hydrolase/SAM-dependent halogenase family protein [Jiangellaceae bacterium]
MYDWVWLLTDYGRSDGFVAACHGVIARSAPAVRIGDITHDVPAFDVRHGAAVLAQTVPYLPPAVIVAVVDPGVGTARRPVAVAAGDSVLLGPDNGLLPWALDALGGGSAAVELSRTTLPAVHTFDGRDLFAPVAARLASGAPIDAVGTPLGTDELVRLSAPRVDVGPGLLATEVLTVDRFGNIQLAATASDLAVAGLERERLTVVAGDRSHRVTVGRTFADAPAGELVLIVDSAGHLALAVNRGHAAAALGLRPRDDVTLKR